MAMIKVCLTPQSWFLSHLCCLSLGFPKKAKKKTNSRIYTYVSSFFSRLGGHLENNQPVTCLGSFPQGLRVQHRPERLTACINTGFCFDYFDYFDASLHAYHISQNFGTLVFFATYSRSDLIGKLVYSRRF